METQPASKSIAYLKQQMMDVQKKMVSVYFSHALFSLLSTHEYLAIQALVWLHKLWPKSDLIWRSLIQHFVCEFKTSHI